MELKEIIKKYSYPAFFVLFPLLIVYASALLGTNNTFRGDDASLGWDTDVLGVFFGESSTRHGGGYFGWFLMQFNCFFLPCMLKLHPADFIGFPNGIFKGIFLVFNLLIFAKFTVSHIKSKVLYACTFVFASVYFFCAVYASDSLIFKINYHYYRYCLSLLFFGIFWLYINRHITGSFKDNNFLKLAFACICGYISASSVEIEIFASAFLIFIIAAHNQIIKLPLFKNIKDSLKFNLNKNFYIPSLFVYASMIIFTSNPAYKIIAGTRGMDDVSLSLINLLPDFLKIYADIYIVQNYLYWIVLLILIIPCFIYAYKNNELKKVLLPLYMLLAVNVLIFSLILCGVTNDELSIPKYSLNNFFLVHNNIVFLYKMILLYPLLLYISYFIKSVKIKKKKILSAFIILAVSSVWGCFKIPEAYMYLYNINENENNPKTIMYIYEKMLRFYYLQHKTPYIYDLNRKDKALPFWYTDDFDESGCALGAYSKVYFAYIYKDDFARNTKYCVSKDALERYYQDGGSFSTEELENVKFQRLFDKDFVLQSFKSGETKEDLLEIIED